MRPNSNNAEGECPDSSVDHSDAALGTAGIDDHDRPSAKTPGGVLSASWQGVSREVGLEGAATAGPSRRVDFPTEHVQPKDNKNNPPSENPRTATTTATAVVTAGVNGKGKICDPEKENVNGFSAQPAQPGLEQGNDYRVLSELIKVGDEQAGDAVEPTPAGGKEGEFTGLDAGAFAESYERGKWLLGLLVLQSTSSFVLDKYQVRTGTSKQPSECCMQEREQGWETRRGLASWRVRCAKILDRLSEPHRLDLVVSRDRHYS